MDQNELEAGTVIIIDEDPSVRASRRRFFRAAGHAVLAYSCAGRLSLCGRPRGPSCLVLNLRRPGETGLAVKKSLDCAGVRIPTIFVIDGGADVPMAVRAKKAGAFELLTRPLDAEQLRRAVDAALEADARQLVVERRLAELRGRFETLTMREREVFFAVTRGLMNKEVAIELRVSEKTVKGHRGRVTEKLAANSVAALVRMADRLQDPLAPTYAICAAPATAPDRAPWARPTPLAARPAFHDRVAV